MSDIALDLSKIKAPATPPAKKPDRLTRAALEAQIHATKVLRANLENESFAQDMSERRKFAARAFVFVCIWMSVVLLIIGGTGFCAEGVTVFGTQVKFSLPEKVLITLLCTTTANVVGLLAIVMKYLFGGNGKPTNPSARARK